MKIIILAGGSGTRLWPVSRVSFPKQFLHFGEEYSLLQKTILRFLKTYHPNDFLIVTNEEYYHLVKNQVEKIQPELKTKIFVEPKRKNTAPAIALSVKFLLERMNISENECILVSSSDHFISPENIFLEKVKIAEDIVKKGFHVTFGIRPHKPETGYGYIKFQESAHPYFHVEEFVEKPDYNTAVKYLMSGKFLWNSGIFLFQIQAFLQDIKLHCPSIYEKLQGSFQEMYQEFDLMPDISIDYAIMEKSKICKVIPLDLNWSDVGSWDNVYEIMEKDEDQNVKIGNVVDLETKNCLLMGQKRLISTIGLEDLIVIDTEDALCIAKKGHSQKVKQLIERLKLNHTKEIEQHATIHRPWGNYTVLEEGERYKIKRIVVLPLQKLSLQMHYHRSEHWVVIKGVAKITLNEKETQLHENESIYVPKSTLHRLENPGKVPLEIIEVQVGEYVGEDDIVRFDDIYGRKTEALALTNT